MQLDIIWVVCCSAFVHSSMEPEWWAKTPEAELHGKLGYRSGVHHRGGQRLHHSFWSPSNKLQQLITHTHTGTSMYVCMHYFHSLSLLPSLFSNRYFLSCLTLQFAPKNFHVVSMFLLYSSSDRTFTITYMTYKHSDLSRLTEKFPPENNSNKIHSCSFTRKSLSRMAAGTERK